MYLLTQDRFYWVWNIFMKKMWCTGMLGNCLCSLFDNHSFSLGFCSWFPPFVCSYALFLISYACELVSSVILFCGSLSDILLQKCIAFFNWMHLSKLKICYYICVFVLCSTYLLFLCYFETHTNIVALLGPRVARVWTLWTFGYVYGLLVVYNMKTIR